MTATEINQAQINQTPEERDERLQELKYVLMSFNAMRHEVLTFASHPGFTINIYTKEFTQMPYPKNVQDLLDKITKQEGIMMKHNFPEFYKPEIYETEKRTEEIE